MGGESNRRLEKLKRMDYLGDLEADGRIILERIPY
jgi:hypothetical protein